MKIQVDIGKSEHGLNEVINAFELRWKVLKSFSEKISFKQEKKDYRVFKDIIIYFTLDIISLSVLFC